MKNFKGSLLVIYSAAAFGLMPLFAKFAYNDGANPLNFLALRYIIAAIILTLIAFFKGENLRLTAKQYLSIGVMGVGGYSMVSFCYFFAITKIPASLTSLLLYTFPIMVTIYALLSGEERFEYRKGLSLIISFIGIAFILDASLQGLDFVGVLLGLGSALFYSIYVILSNKLLKTISSIITTTYMVWSAAITCSLVSLVTGNLNLDFGPTALLGIIGIALISTVSGILAFLTGLKITGPTNASILSTVEPLVTVLVFYMLFSEYLSTIQIFGGGFILIAAVLLQLPNKANKSQFPENNM